MLGQLERLDRLRRKAEKHTPEADDSLPDYPGSVQETYRQLYPGYLDAPHLAPLLDLFERAKYEPVRACVSYPPRAGKTESVIAGVCDRLLESPETRIAYGSYAANFAKKKSARIRSLARQHGVPIDPATRSKQDWSTGRSKGGGEPGGLWATSVAGQITGMGFDLAVLDDLIKGREEAESLAIRDAAHTWILTDVSTRLEPGGSIIVNGTRWHDDDPIGRLIRDGWEEINVPAFTESGESYWPERWSREHLLRLQDTLGGPDGYDWSALYMGQPRAAGDAVFKDACLFDEIPPGPMRIGIGFDLAYTVKKSSDFSVYVVLAEVYGIYYVIDVVRVRVSEAEFREKIAKAAESYNTSLVTGYLAATEQPTIDLLQDDGLPAYGMRAVADKKSRALPAASAWNLQRIKVRANQPWTREFVREVVSFTGADRHDDQVDALAAVYDAMHVGGAIDWDFIKKVQQHAPQAFNMPGLN